MHDNLPEKIDVVIKLMDQAEKKLALVKAMIKQLCLWKGEGADITDVNLGRILENAELAHKQFILSTNCLRVIHEDMGLSEDPWAMDPQ